jgi:hypothetical protein
VTARDPAAQQRLDAALQPAVTRVAHARAAARNQRGLHVALRALPKFSAVVAVIALTAALQWPLPWWLPVLVAGLGCAIAFARGRGPAPTHVAQTPDAAVACDRAHDNQDRLSAACELAAAPTQTADLADALARAAIDDGVASLARVDVTRVALPAAPTRPALWPAAVSILALLALPLMFATPASHAQHTADGAPALQSTTSSVARAAPARVARGADVPTTLRSEAEAERRDGRPKPSSPPPPPKTEPVPAVPAASGRGQSGSDAAGESTQTGAPKAAPAGKAGSGQSGGGAGSAASGAPEPQQDEQQAKAAPKPKAAKPQKDMPQQDGKPSESAGAPSGPSRGSGRMAAVGNKRNDLNRGLEREDDPEVEDEPVEDESDEQEQRGGVMPMRRGDNRPAARELSISGDGPPDQGRGGPTPPKKARGTASLVLGLRLPDSVRGQPNPGTAKTSLEQIPPRPSTAETGLAAAAGQGRAATPQSARHPTSLASLLLAYHGWLAQQEVATPSSNPVSANSK